MRTAILMATLTIMLGLTAGCQDQGSPGNPNPAVDSYGMVRIGAWNIENLGTRNPEQDPEMLADYIRTSKVVVLALEEIHDGDQPNDRTPGKAPWTNPLLEDALSILSEDEGGEWKTALSAPSTANWRQQMTGVAWDSKRVKLVDRYPIPVKGGLHNNNPSVTYWTRRPEAFLFSFGDGKTDFVVVPLHLKSNSGGPDGAAIRRVEAKQLFEALPALRKRFPGEKDIVLMGDTNMLAGEKLEAGLEKEFRDLNSEFRYTFIRPHRNDPFPPFDRIFVPIGQPEFPAVQQKVHGPYGQGSDVRREWRDEHLEERSDHLLVWTDLVISVDDDPAP